jgi:hypothetical protein
LGIERDPAPLFQRTHGVKFNSGVTQHTGTCARRFSVTHKSNSMTLCQSAKNVPRSNSLSGIKWIRDFFVQDQDPKGAT